MAIELKPPARTTPRVQILSRRATCIGTQYIVADPYGTEIVTVNNGCIGCSCGLDRYFVTCSHIRVVERQREVDAMLDARRALMQTLFEPTNMDYLYS